jgi:hypothetical protein
MESFNQSNTVSHTPIANYEGYRQEGNWREVIWVYTKRDIGLTQKTPTP